MSNRAWMPLHIEAYLSDTDHLSAAEHGAYMLLIMKYWRDGGLPADEGMIRRYAKLTPEQWADSRNILAAFFEDGWRHKRIDAELAKADEIIEKRRAAAEAKHAKSKRSAHAEHMQSKCGDTRVPPSTDNHSSSLRSEEGARSRASSPAGFADFWSIYPNKVGKRDAEKAFAKARQRASLESILDGLRRYAAKTDDRPWCNPATWLNQDRWEDRPATVTPVPRQSTAPPSNMDRVNSILDEIQGKPHVPQHSGPTIDASDGRADRGGAPNLVQLHAVSSWSRS